MWGFNGNVLITPKQDIGGRQQTKDLDASFDQTHTYHRPEAPMNEVLCDWRCNAEQKIFEHEACLEGFAAPRSPYVERPLHF